MVFRPRRRIKAITTATGVACTNQPGSSVNAVPQNERSTKPVVYAMSVNTTDTIPSSRASVSSVGSVNSDADRPRDGTTGQVANAVPGLSINVDSSTRVRSNPQSNTPSPHVRMLTQPLARCLCANSLHLRDLTIPCLSLCYSASFSSRTTTRRLARYVDTPSYKRCELANRLYSQRV